MGLPIVMPANNVQTAEELHIEFPGRIGALLTPGNWKQSPVSVPFVLDNGRYAVWSSGKKWDSKEFRRHLDLAKEVGNDPLWVVVPDKVGDASGTLKDWDRWVKRLQRYGWPLALAVQDGMEIEDVLGLDIQPDVIFVGGTTKWKWAHARQWCKEFDRVHIGRVGTENRLWMAQRCGAESTDSNIWRPIGRHLESLRRYLIESEQGSGKGRDRKGFGLLE